MAPPAGGFLRAPNGAPANKGSYVDLGQIRRRALTIGGEDGATPRTAPREEFGGLDGEGRVLGVIVP